MHPSDINVPVVNPALTAALATDARHPTPATRRAYGGPDSNGGQQTRPVGN